MKSFMFKTINFSIVSMLMLCCHQPTQATNIHTEFQSDRLFGDGGTSEFYIPPKVLPNQAGKLIKFEDIKGVHIPESAGRAVRILYVSTSGVGKSEPIAVSGQIFFPKSPAPKGGWPIISWEHGTTGIADVCAPSWRGYFSRDRTYLNKWLDAGFVVVASDYQGLGTPGPHPYLLYKSESYSVLDALRASLLQYKDLINNKIILVGQSQGGGAALGAGWMAPRYAPELNIIGVVATGIVTAFHTPQTGTYPQISAPNKEPPHMAAAFGILTVEGSQKSLHPEMDMRPFMTEKGEAFSHEARQTCLGSLFKYADKNDVTEENVYISGLAALQKVYREEFTIPDAHLTMPVFVGTGLADNEAGVAQQYNAVAAMCDAGTKVIWKKYRGLTHNGAVNGASAEALSFVKALIKGKNLYGYCKGIKPISEVEMPKSGIPFNN